MSDIRILKPGRAYELTHTLVDREFSFRPDHRRDNALLFEECPVEALELENEIYYCPKQRAGVVNHLAAVEFPVG